MQVQYTSSEVATKAEELANTYTQAELEEMLSQTNARLETATQGHVQMIENGFAASLSERMLQNLVVVTSNSQHAAAIRVALESCEVGSEIEPFTSERMEW